MNPNYSIRTLVLIAAIALGGCATDGYQQNPAPYAAPYSSESGAHGTVESIQMTRAGGNTSGTGALVGGLVGGLLGNQIGAGNGRAAATVAGVVGGAVVGNSIEQNRNARAQDMYEVQVRLRNGDYISVVQENVGDLRVGDRVRVVDGRAYRY